MVSPLRKQLFNLKSRELSTGHDVVTQGLSATQFSLLGPNIAKIEKLQWDAAADRCNSAVHGAEFG
eukprot:1825729-Pleurochrysis_carterae.AAC.1